MPEDDAYIHRRIALQLLQSGHAYFNAGERVMVTSSPVWTILLAIADKLLPVANPVPWLELPFLLVAPAAAYLLLRDENQDLLYRRLVPVIAFASTFLAILPGAMEQMETPCAIALMLAGCLGVARGWSWGMPLLFLACLTRYECVLLAVIAISYMTRARRWTTTAVIACTFITLPSLAWLWSQYGTLIPNTVIAKARVYRLTYAESMAMLTGSTIHTVCVFALLFATLVYARKRYRDISIAAAALLALGALLAFAYVARKTFIFPWYLELVWVPLAIGTLILCANAKALFKTSLGILTAVVLIAPFARSDAALLTGVLRGQPGKTFATNARVHEYLRIGTALNQACPSATLMTAEIGGLGWAFPGRILDGVGLASPAALKFHPLAVPSERSNGLTGEIPSGFVVEQQPDLIVTYDYFAESALPTARQLGYTDFTYPLFVREDRARMHGLWTAKAMHVLVAPNGKCSAKAVDEAVGAAL